MKWTAPLVALVILFTVTSCGTIYLDGRDLGERVSVNAADTPGYTVLEEFHIEDKGGWIIIIPVNPPAGDRQQYFETMLRDVIEKAGGDAIIDLTIKSQNDFIDFLTSAVTLGFYTTRTVILEGKVIKYN